MTDQTIKELADILGVSKDKVKYQLRKVPSKFTYKKGNVTYLKKEAITMITKNLSDNELGNLPNELPIDYLLSELKIKSKYLDEKDKQIGKLQIALETQQKLLDQQQQLTLQANKQIEKLQEQLQLTYTEDTPESSTTSVTEENEKEPIIDEKKWWQFWQ
ncbi:DUF536 domain-containing protein [Enterococcus hirae]